MAAGGGMPRHTNSVEHEQYVLKGKASIGIGDKTFQVSEGDVVFIPAEVPHWYTNIGEGNFEFLCLIPNKEDIVKIVPDNSEC
jgi:quercetin dioxygenase-like cupin family protein